MKRTTVLLAFLALAACDDPQEVAAPVERPDQQEASSQPAEVDSVEQAMNEIAPADRVAFQSALSCNVKKTPEKGIEVTAEYVRGLYAELKSNPAIAQC